jgi:hypothetical protein
MYMYIDGRREGQRFQVHNAIIFTLSATPSASERVCTRISHLRTISLYFLHNSAAAEAGDGSSSSKHINTWIPYSWSEILARVTAGHYPAEVVLGIFLVQV